MLLFITQAGKPGGKWHRQAPCPQHSPGQEVGSPFTPLSPLLNLRVRQPDISAARSGLSILTQFLSPAPPFASRPPVSQVQKPRREVAGPSRAQSSSQPSESAGQELELQPKGAFLILPTTSPFCIISVLSAGLRPLIP